jgi:hypothetical protein
MSVHSTAECFSGSLLTGFPDQQFVEKITMRQGRLAHLKDVF